MADVPTTTTSEEILLDVLHIGKAISQEVSRHNFITDSGVAEKLRNRCEYFISALTIVSRQLPLEAENQLTDDLLLAIIEFQRIISHLEEHFNNFEEERLHFVCPVGGEGRGRPKLVIPKEQLEGLRSLGFSWAAISRMLGVSERTIRRRREAFDGPNFFEDFSQISDEQIDHHVENVLRMSPNW